MSHLVPVPDELDDERDEPVDPEGRRSPPVHLPAESSVLGNILLEGAPALARVRDFLRAEHFYSGMHQRIFEGCLALDADGTPIGLVTLHAWLKDRRRSAEVPAGYLAEIAEGAGPAAHLMHHARIVFDHWRARTVMKRCEEGVARGYADLGDVQEYIDGIVHDVALISRQTANPQFEGGGAAVLRIIDRMRATMVKPVNEQRSPGLPTGLKRYDALTLGLHMGEKTTVVALPRVGKTAFALQWGIELAKLGVGVFFASGEMTREQLAERKLAYAAGIDSRRIRRAQTENVLTQDEWNRIHEASAWLAPLPLIISDVSKLDIDDICSRAIQLKAQCSAVYKAPLAAVIVDYIQKLKPAKSVERRKKNEQVEYATVRLTNLAKEENLIVIELAQATAPVRDFKTQKARAPELEDVAESKTIVKEAHNVVHLYRPIEKDGERVIARILKQRNGVEQDISLRLDGPTGRFEERDESDIHGMPSDEFFG